VTERDEFDAKSFNSLLREGLHEAARQDCSAEQLVTLLRQHATEIERDGLDGHVGLSSIPDSRSDDDREQGATEELSA